MASGIPSLTEDAGFASARIQPTNYTTVDGEWAYAIGSDLPGRYRDVAVGDISGLEQYLDLTSTTAITFAVSIRQTEGATSGARRGTGATYPKAFSTGDTIKLKVDGGSELTITFQDTDNSLSELVDRCNAQLTGAVASADNAQLKFTSDTTGTNSSIEITGGTVYTNLGHSLGITSGEYVTFRAVIEIDGIEADTFQPTAGDTLTYEMRTINVSHMTGFHNIRIYGEAVAS